MQSDKGTKLKTSVKTYRNLIVWQKSMVLVTETYKFTNSFPESEQFGLTSQIRRSAVSIPSNIAEGFGRNSKNDYLRFLQISISSLFELQTQIEISFNLNYLLKKSFGGLYRKTKELERMLSSLIRKLKGNSIG